jgi:diacylglycerol kinase family enzyme
MANAIPVIVNANAGLHADDGRVDKIKAAFAAAGAEARIILCQAADLEANIAMEAGAGALVVAAGGDGTVSTVAAIVARTGGTLGVLPMGTLNHFAKDLGVPLELGAAVTCVLAGHAIEVDLAEVNGHTFINNSSIGLYPKMVRIREAKQKRDHMGKWRALYHATAAVLRRHSRMRVRLELDDKIEDRRAPIVFIGNNAYNAEGFAAGRRERLDKGELSIYVTQRKGPWALIGLGMRALAGRLDNADGFEALTARKVRIETERRRIPVATDGEVQVMETPLEYQIHPRALRVIAPAPQPPA